MASLVFHGTYTVGLGWDDLMRKNTALSAAAAVLAAGLTIAGCGSSASSSPSGSGTRTGTASSGTPTGGSTSAGAATTASVPFPIAVGNTWKYNITAASASGTTVNKMTAVTPVPDGQQVTMTTTDHLNGSSPTTTETYVFHSDGSISYPLGTFSPGSGVSVSSNGVVWPPASVIASGKPTQSQLKLTIKAAGQTLSTTANVTVQGEGTATVTVPAGTYQATVVLVTEKIAIVGVTADIQVKTWLAPNVGPVKDQVVTSDAGAANIAATEELVSFTKG